MESAVAIATNADDAEYGTFLQRLQARLDRASGPLFKTDAELWPAYLDSFAEGATRQYHTCSACRRFITRFGGLVTIDDAGKTTPVMWDDDEAPDSLRPAITTLQALVTRAAVTGVFLSSDAVWGLPVTGPWRHLAVRPAAGLLFRRTRVTAGQKMAERREDYKNVRRALSEITGPQLHQALALLRGNHLYRGEKLLGQAEWLDHLFQVRKSAAGGKAQANVIWRAVATAPEGFCHPRSSMIGTLLDDIAAGLPFADVERRFADKMDPLRYGRAQTAPSAGQIEVAERAVAELGVAPAFARRYVVDSDIPASLWSPSDTPVRVPAADAAVKPIGVFDHLKPVDAGTPAMDIPPKTVTWEKFVSEGLRGAAEIHYRVPMVGRFCALTAAADLVAPPVLQWDQPGRRNTVSWAFPSPPARAEDWNLKPGQLVRVRRIVTQPNEWAADPAFAHHGKGVFLLLDGARDVRGLPGGGLFTEHLRGDLKPYRSTIEAHLNRLTVVGADDPASIGFGIGLLAGNDWTEVAAPRSPTGATSTGVAPRCIHVLLVVDDSGSMAAYITAARDALVHLLGAVRAMPGQVDVSVTLFGSRATTLVSRAPLDHLHGIEQQLRGCSGNTALNDTLISVIDQAVRWPDAAQLDTSFFLGIVTDGEENHSRHTTGDVLSRVTRAIGSGRWTIAYAGAGRHPRHYARSIGIPEGNITEFEASTRGFERVGAIYAESTADLARSYASGQRASTSFFAAASGRRAIGTDHPVLEVTRKSGERAVYALNRWD